MIKPALALSLLLLGCHSSTKSAPLGVTVALSVAAPKCGVVALGGEPYCATFSTPQSGQLVAELYTVSGTVVLSRDALSANGTTKLCVGAALAEGPQTLGVWLDAGLAGSSERTLIALDARPVIAGASTVDQDGDCYPPSLGDCNDSNPNINPGVREICNNKIDDNCNGLIDLADPECFGLCADADGDGEPAATCGGTDCNDHDPTIGQFQPERCNGIDDNCNGIADEPFDQDGDGYTTCTGTTGILSGPSALGGSGPKAPIVKDDCDDNDAQISPALSESAFACDGKDNDCSGFDAHHVLVGVGTRYIDDVYDLDQDGYTSCGSMAGCTIGESAPCANVNYANLAPSLASVTLAPALADCYDAAANPTAQQMHPGAKEICDGLDNDCNCPYGQLGQPADWPALVAAGTSVGMACIDDPFDHDGDGYAGDASCPTQLARRSDGAVCVSSVKFRYSGQTPVAVQPSCFDCNECTAPGCVNGTLTGAAIHPSTASDSPNEGSGTTCSDHIDNDCDGYVDALDADCSTCGTQTEILRQTFDTDSVSGMLGNLGAHAWQSGLHAPAGPLVADFSEGRNNGVLGIEGNQATYNSCQSVSAGVVSEQSTYWNLALPNSGSTPSSSLAYYVGLRSWTYNEGYPTWPGAGAIGDDGLPLVQDGGTCTDVRNGSGSVQRLESFPAIDDIPSTFLAPRDQEALGICTESICSPFSNLVATCATTPELDFPFDGRWRVLKAGLSYAQIQALTQTGNSLAGFFSTGEWNKSCDTSGEDLPICFGGTGPNQAWDDPTPEDIALGDPFATSNADTCSATNRDDGWYVDDLVIYSCAETCASPCGSACCATNTAGFTGDQYCANQQCAGCATGEQGCNTTCCASGYYCADFANSYCALANVDSACGPTRTSCASNGKTCGFPGKNATAGVANDCDASDTTNPLCACYYPGSDNFCGTGVLSWPPRQTCTASTHCQQCIRNGVNQCDLANGSHYVACQSTAPGASCVCH